MYHSASDCLAVAIQLDPLHGELVRLAAENEERLAVDDELSGAALPAELRQAAVAGFAPRRQALPCAAETRQRSGVSSLIHEGVIGEHLPVLRFTTRGPLRLQAIEQHDLLSEHLAPEVLAGLAMRPRKARGHRERDVA